MQRQEKITYSIGAAARQAGLTPAVIRAWERRYAAVVPGRTDSNRRFYTEENVRRLKLLRQATEMGHSIGRVADLKTETLAELISREGPRPVFRSKVPDSKRLQEAFEAVKRLQPDRLSRILERAVADLSQPALLNELVAPLIEKIGEGWEKGELRPAQEHVASEVLVSFLGATLNSISTPRPGAPTLLVAVPRNQWHSLGALMVAIMAASEGWKVIYTGPNLPAEEIAGAVALGQADVLALSLVYPPDDETLPGQLRRLRDLVGEHLPVVVGGRVASAYAKVLKELEAVTLPGLGDIRSFLRSHAPHLYT